MKAVLRSLAFALAVLALVSVATSSAVIGKQHEPTKPRLAGPWYTPKELKALIAYSNASFTEKKKLLAGTSR